MVHQYLKKLSSRCDNSQRIPQKTFTTIGEETGNKLINTEEGGFMQVDLRKYAQKQLLSENIPKINIDVSNLCTFESKNEFHSWRRAKPN